MVGLFILFVDRREKIYKLYENQAAYKWTDINNNINNMRYSLIYYGGSRKRQNTERYIKYLEKERCSECTTEIDFVKVLDRLKMD